MVTGERKACPSGSGKATHAKLERNVNHGMMHGYFLFFVGQFKVILYLTLMLEITSAEPVAVPEDRMPEGQNAFKEELFGRSMV